MSLLGLAFLFCHLGVAPQQYSLTQYMAMKRANDPSLSPNAGQVAYATNATGNWQVFVASANGSGAKQLTKFSGGVSGAQWAPNGSNIQVSADKDGDQKYQFFLVDAGTGATTQLTTNSDAQNDFGGWTADGKSIFYTSNSRDPKFFDCYLMDVSNKKHQLVFQEDSVLHARAISKDGRYIAAEENRSELNNNLLLVDTTTKTARNITQHKGNSRFTALGFSGDGKMIYYLSNDARETMAIVSQNLVSGAKDVLVTANGDIDYAVVDPEGRRLAVSENVAGYEQISVWDIKTRTRLKLPKLPEGINIPQQFSTDGSKLAIVVSTPVHDDEVWVIDLQARKAHQVTHSDQGGIAQSALFLPKAIHYRSFDGLEISALYYQPRGSSPTQRAPVILSLHGGPEGQEQPYLTNYYQFLVSHGYAILAPNVRGSTGYGKSFLEMDNGPLRWNALKDIAYAVRWIKAQPDLDGSKVACFGPSYGGFATLAMLAFYPDLFKAGVDFYGPSDLKSFLNDTAEYRRPNRIAKYGDPVKDSAFLDAISPALHADKIKAPLLVVQGETDPIVPRAESDRIVDIVKKRGGTVDYLVIPKEGHGFSEAADYVKAFERMLQFLEKYMPPPGASVRTGD